MVHTQEREFTLDINRPRRCGGTYTLTFKIYKILADEVWGRGEFLSRELIG